MAKFTDPVANARTVGFLCLLIAVVDLLGGDFSLMGIIKIALYLAVGFGLWKRKLWGLYIFGGLAIYSVIFFLYLLSLGFPITITMLFDPVITVGLFAWFWSGKDRFEK